MSWQGYVDTNLLGTGKVSKAAILGQQGGVWATSSGFTLSPEEQQRVMELFADRDNALANGVTLGGTKYFALQANERSFYGKKQADGCVIVKTKQAILVALYTAPLQAAETTPVTEGLADYLISVGY
ncbi:profilin, required for normal timing of actin polymerization in response to thermal stress [Ceratobasidium sp. 394]|nr:profilin, required for normal timing of actin polymerization in response to thermal stress [Ceratobasidium sp. 394]KAG9099401.1 profilin, required for normal timing of actin polymerization in response to thermal stress [Ceratobasidium sp. UAMH 11750]